MAIKLADLFVLIGADDDQLDDDLKNTETKTKGWLGRVSGGITKALGGAIVAGAATAGAAIAGIGTAAWNMSGEVDAAVNLMSARIDGFELHAEKLEGAMLDVFGTGFTDSLEDAGESITAVFNAAGWAARGLSEDELANVTKQALAMRDVFEIDVAESVAVASRMVNTGLVPSFEDAFDVIITGYQNGTNAQDDLLDTLNEYADDFARMGMDGAGALDLLNSGLIAGALNTDKIADAVNEFGIRLKDPAILDSVADIDSSVAALVQQFQAGELTEGEAFTAIIHQLRDVDDAITRDQAGVQLFGSMWEDMGEQAILGIELLDGAWVGVSGAADELMNRQLSIGQRLTTLWQNFQVVALLPIGEIMRDLVNQVMPSVEAALGGFAEQLPLMFQDFVDNTLPRIVEFIQTTLIPAFQSIMNVVVGTVIPALRTAFGWLTDTALPAVSEFVQSTLIPAFTRIRDFFTNDLQPASEGVFGRLTDEILPKITTFVQDRLIPIFGLMRETFIETGIAVRGFIEDRLIPAFQTIRTVLVDEILPRAQEVFNTIAGYIQDVLVPAIMVIVEAITDHLWPAAKKVFDWLSEAIPKLAAFFLEHILPVLMDIVGWIINEGVPLVSNIIAGIIRFISDVVVPAILAIKNVIATVWNFLQPILIFILDNILPRLGDLLNNVIIPVIQRIASVVSEVMAALSGFFEWLTDRITAISEVVLNISNGIRNTWDTLWSEIRGLFDNAISSIVNMDWVGVGMSIVNGIANGIRNFGSSIADSLGNAAADALNRAKNLLGIQSPSTVFADEVGGPIAEGVAQGIGTETVGIADALNRAIQLPQIPQIGALAPAAAGVGTAAAGAASNITINFNGTGGPVTPAEADEAARWMLEAMRLRGASV